MDLDRNAPDRELRRQPYVQENAKGARDAGLAILKQRFGERLATSQALREQHAHATSWLERQLPDAVVFAHTESEVREVVRIAADHAVPIIAFGAGTSLEGHVNAPHGGISLDLSAMNAIKSVRPDDLDCTVEPGVTRMQLNEHLRDTGLFFAVDPGADWATLGGMAATRASGTNAVRYGTMRDTVLALRAVLANGDLITTGRRARKSAAGYDLTHLLIGSEGTLGIITELTVRLHGRPETVLSAVCPFRSIEGACNTVIAAIQLGLPVARVEFLDPVQIRACNAYSDLALEEAPTLFIEIHGTPVSARDTVDAFAALAGDEGSIRFDWADAEEARNALWRARHDAYWAARALRPGADSVATDVCVPISRLAQCILETHADAERLGLTCPIVGHVGDGNFHTLPLIDRTDEQEVAAGDAFLKRLAERAMAMDGTCTGEHGIGQGKKPYLEAELGPQAVDAMRAIKAALDPANLLNPSKIF